MTATNRFSLCLLLLTVPTWSASAADGAAPCVPAPGCAPAVASGGCAARPLVRPRVRRLLLRRPRRSTAPKLKR